MNDNTNGKFFCQNLLFGPNTQLLGEAFNGEFSPGEIYVLLGPNGSGKTSFLKTIAGLVQPCAGVLKVSNINFTELSAIEKAKRVSILSTKWPTNLEYRVWDLLILARYPYRGESEETSNLIVSKTLEQFDLLDLKDRVLATLSDGQRQKAMIARAFCQTPQCSILLDEPFNHLDMNKKEWMIEKIKSLALSMKISVIFSCHEKFIIDRIGNKLEIIPGKRIEFFKSKLT